MTISMDQLKKLRALTQAPLGDCKQALVEAEGDIEKAQKILRDKGAAKLGKKADRETNEGIVVIKQVGNKIAGIKFACETDFVAKNDIFRGIAQQIVDMVAASADEVASVVHLSDVVKHQIDTLIKDNFVTIGENMQVLDAFVTSTKGYIYTHPGDKIAVVVFYEGDEATAKHAALQVAAMNPEYRTVEEVPADMVAAVKQEMMAGLAEDKKPDDIKEKIVEGKLAKYFAEIVFMEQPSITDDTKKMKELLGEKTRVSGYIRYAI